MSAAASRAGGDNPVARNVAAQIRALRPYRPGVSIREAAARGGAKDILKLASNENPLGMAPAAAAALATARDFSRYPDYGAGDLRARLAARAGVAPENIVLGNGSNEIIELAAHLVLTPTTAAVFSRFAFGVYRLATAARRARAIEIASPDGAHDLAAMAAAAGDDPAVKIVFVANPNNPTGSWHNEAAIESFLESIPPSTLVLLDEAYFEYASEDWPRDFAAARWLARFPNLIVARTFSKIYGLAGLRIGYGLADAAVAALLNAIRQPFNVNAAALVAAAGALEDDDFPRRSRALNRAGMAQMRAGLESLGAVVSPSRGNFVSFAPPPRFAGDAAAAFSALLADGVVLRALADYDMPRHLRATIGDAAQNRRALDSLARVFAA